MPSDSIEMVVLTGDRVLLRGGVIPVGDSPEGLLLRLTGVPAGWVRIREVADRLFAVELPEPTPLPMPDTTWADLARLIERDSPAIPTIMQALRAR